MSKPKAKRKAPAKETELHLMTEAEAERIDPGQFQVPGELLDAPGLPLRFSSPAVERQAFLDATAVAMFARGFPTRDIWSHCEKLWASREAYMKAGSK